MKEKQVPALSSNPMPRRLFIGLLAGSAGYAALPFMGTHATTGPAVKSVSTVRYVIKAAPGVRYSKSFITLSERSRFTSWQQAAAVGKKYKKSFLIEEVTCEI